MRGAGGRGPEVERAHEGLRPPKDAVPLAGALGDVEAQVADRDDLGEIVASLGPGLGGVT